MLAYWQQGWVTSDEVEGKQEKASKEGRDDNMQAVSIRWAELRGKRGALKIKACNTGDKLLKCYTHLNNPEPLIYPENMKESGARRGRPDISGARRKS